MNLLITLLFPFVILIGLLCFFAYYIHSGIPRKGTLEWITRSMNERPRRFTFSAAVHPMSRTDILPILLVTALYAVSVFWNLGSLSAPQSLWQPTAEQPLTFSTQKTVTLSQVAFYTGLGSGSYTLEFSSDGVNWTRVELEQDAPHQFQWRQVQLPEGNHTARYFSLTAHSTDKRMELGELALFDENNALIAVTADSAAALFDEQNTVPAATHWSNSTYFNEAAYAGTAWEYLQGIAPSETAHPPLGKLIIALGIQLFGMTAFGWRFMGALFGVLMLPLLYLFLKNLFGKTAIALCGSVLFAAEFLHLSQTRMATSDAFGLFFTLAMFYFLYRFLALPAGTPWRKCALPLLLSGLMFGLGVACTWRVLFGAAGMAVLYLLALIWKCRDWPLPTQGPRRWAWLLKTILFSILCFVLLPALLYTACYLPMAFAHGVSVTDWKGLLGLVWANQVQMLRLHWSAAAPHPYASQWYHWLLNLHPTLYYTLNEDTLGYATHLAAFHNPIVIWGGLLALVTLAVQTFRRHCGKGMLILIGTLSQLIPWIVLGFVRTTFAYHNFGTVLFLCMALAYVMNDLAESGRRWKPAVFTLTGAAVVLYALFYPVLAGIRIPMVWMHILLRWLPTWPF